MEHEGCKKNEKRKESENQRNKRKGCEQVGGGRGPIAQQHLRGGRIDKALLIADKRTAVLLTL